MADRRRIGAGFYVLLFVIVVLTFALHEAGHWAMAEALGHDAFYGLNSAGVRAAVPERDALLITAAGPAVTVVQALVAFALVMAGAGRTAWVVLYAAAFMRFMATVVTLINPNDEARLGLAFGWGTWTLPLAMTLALGALAWIGARRLRLPWPVGPIAWAVASLAVSAVVGADMLLTR